MSREETTLRDGFLSYRYAAYDQPLSAVQLEEVRKSFYAGCVFMQRRVLARFSAEPQLKPEEVHALFNADNRELEQFLEDVVSSQPVSGSA